MNYWQFKFKEGKWRDWSEVSIGEVVSWPSPKTRRGKPNDIEIGDIVFLYRIDKKKDRGIHFLSKVIDVDFEDDDYPILLEIIKDLKENIFKPELFGFQKVIQKINHLDQRSTCYYKFEEDDNSEKMYKLILSEIDFNNDIEEIFTDNSASNTEVRSNLLIRLGQGKFRQKLVEYWQGCALTGHKQINLLVASHIKPWKDSNNKERLDVYNGLLLLPNIDKLFDKGYISFDNNGKILLSNEIKNYEVLGINNKMKIKLEKKHLLYLEYHRENIFIR